LEDELRQELRETEPPLSDEYIERCIPLVLIDLTIANANSRFNVSDFAQEMEGVDSPQVAYEEAVLSKDGQVIERGLGCADNLRNGRIAFYLHYFDPSKPLKWTYGTITCPEAQIMPASLWKAMPYEPIDEDEEEEVSPE